MLDLIRAFKNFLFLFLKVVNDAIFHKNRLTAKPPLCLARARNVHATCSACPAKFKYFFILNILMQLNS